VPDEVVRRAVERACQGVVYELPSRREAQLVKALLRQLTTDERVASIRTECRFPLTEWTRPPGGVDISAELEPQGTIVIETKVDKPEEAIWDVIKLADILTLDSHVTAAYLVYDATTKVWSKADLTSNLFGNAERALSAHQLIENAREDWAWLLKGGRGIRPVSCTGAVSLERICISALRAHEGHQLRALLVSADPAVPRQRFDDEGWPIG
jgi:hypothetical protein